jgi:hypothetical protein
MSDDERQRQMDFIVSSQAKSEQRLDRLERVVKLALRAGLRTRRDMREQLRALVDSHIRLADAQAKTDERINALIGAIERHVSDGHGGHNAQG